MFISRPDITDQRNSLSLEAKRDSIGMNLFKLVRYIFVLIQSILALQFIIDAYNEWNDSPIVSSGILKLRPALNVSTLMEPFFKVTIQEVDQEPFPAVSICIPTSWKWPGVTKAMGKMYPEIKTFMATTYRFYLKSNITLLKF